MKEDNIVIDSVRSSSTENILLNSLNRDNNKEKNNEEKNNKIITKEE